MINALNEMFNLNEYERISECLNEVTQLYRTVKGRMVTCKHKDGKYLLTDYITKKIVAQYEIEES